VTVPYFLPYFLNNILSLVMAKLTHNIVYLGIFSGICASALYMGYLHIQRQNIKIFRTKCSIYSLQTAMHAEAAVRNQMPPENMREMVDWLSRDKDSQIWFDQIRRNVSVDLEHGILFDAWGTPIWLVRVKDSVVSAIPDIYVLVSFGPNRRNDGGLQDDIVGRMKIPSQTSDSEFRNAEPGSELSKIIRAIGDK
jgi:hypothetical protein